MARILIIEDNPINLELARYLLAAHGHEVLTAEDGEQGLEILRRETPHLIICDLQLPGINGYEIAARLKQHPALSRIPLVAVTAYAMVGDREKVFQAGFDGYVSKPLDPQGFVPQIDTFLPQALQSRAAAAAQPDEPPQQPEATPVHHGTALIVDDSPENRSLIETILSATGYRVVQAASAEEALQLARRERPDLILSDLHMPGASGLHLLKAVRNDDALRALPFIFLSCTADDDSIPPEADGLIRRPIDPQAMIDRIKTCLARRAG